MLNLCIYGSNGRMGEAIFDCLKKFENINIVAGIDDNIKKANYDNEKIYYSNNLKDLLNKNIDVIIDVSNPNAIYNLYDFCLLKKVPIVICTTGYNTEQEELITTMSKIIPVFKSGNMSMGINIVNQILNYVTKLLYNNNFDIEILEKHHNQKKDSPSGTALMLAKTISKKLSLQTNYVYDRNSIRNKNDIGIQSIRGGSIIGEHDIIFAGNDEIITISHVALSRKIFANGAIYAAIFLKSCIDAKLYNMDDLLNKLK